MLIESEQCPRRHFVLIALSGHYSVIEITVHFYGSVLETCELGMVYHCLNQKFRGPKIY